jgi:hypothetical protein
MIVRQDGVIICKNRDQTTENGDQGSGVKDSEQWSMIADGGPAAAGGYRLPVGLACLSKRRCEDRGCGRANF